MHSPHTPCSTATVPVLLALSLPLLSSCAGGPDPAPPAKPDPRIEEEAVRRKRAEEAFRRRQHDLANVLLTLDKMLDKYAEAVMGSNYWRNEQRAASIRRAIATLVEENFDQIARAADDERYPANRAIAVAALGFTSSIEEIVPPERKGDPALKQRLQTRIEAALQSMLNALEAQDQTIVRNALFGLAELHEPRTPVERIARFVEDDSVPLKTRIGASYALIRLQPVSLEPERILRVWLRILEQPSGQVDPAIAVHAVRGVGFSRDRRYSDVVEPYTEHPTPLVRCAAAVALGRLGDQDAYTRLLDLISPAETNPNVRLFARKALQALAGGLDRGYDVRQWRQVFERK